MKTMTELVNQTFVLKCGCGLQEGKGVPTYCNTPVYNEGYNAVFCEKCNHPAFLSLVEPSEMKRNPEIEQAMLKSYFVLHSDQAMLDSLVKMKELHTQEQTKEIIPAKNLTLLDILQEEEKNESNDT